MSDDKPRGEPASGNRYRSFFWPVILIGVGIIWLLVNLEIIQGSALGVLLRFWPVVLILIGLDIIFTRRHSVAGALLGLLTIGLVIAALVLGGNALSSQISASGFPGIFGSRDVQSGQFTEPLGQAKSADVTIELANWRTDITSLDNTGNLVEADVDYIGRFVFEARGESNKRIHIRQDANLFMSWGPFSGAYNWNLGLTPQIPLNLKINTASGANTLNLSGLNLTRLEVEGGSGSTALTLPATEQRLPVTINSRSGRFEMSAPAYFKADIEFNAASGGVDLVLGDASDVYLSWEGGSGSQRITIGRDANLEAVMRTTSGSISIDVPDDCALRVEIQQSGSGSIHLPNGLERLTGSGKEGVWETPGYNNARERINLRLKTGSGSVTIS